MTNNTVKPKHNLMDDLNAHNPSVDWRARLNNPVRRVLNILERISLLAEKPVDRIVGDARFNPLYHTGTITIFLLFVILFTGLYLTMFYPFGFTLSYEAVSKIEVNLIGRFIRALHRYASDAAVIFALLHGWRTFFQDRFRGPRWLAWTTGVGMAFVVWFIGVTGYWLIWDNRAQILNQTLFSLFGDFQKGEEFIVKFMVSDAASSGWAFMFTVILLHVGLSALVGLFLWWHLKRMSRAKWLPPRYWMIITFALLGIAAILFPLGMLPPVNPTQLPEQSSIDLFYLFYLPAALRGPTALFWSGVLLAVGLVTLLPWILPRKKIEPVKVDLSLCDGCTLCERDCPYTAIKMTPRTDGARAKWEATIDPKLCVACGVCIGSCPENALTFGDIPLDPLWQTTLAQVSKNNNVRVVFTCERHALHGARDQFNREDTFVVPLTCIAMANPRLTAQAIENGAKVVQFIGCPAEDCANREGNVWMQGRLSGERFPKLKPNFAPSVRMDWLDPTDFKRAFKSQNEATAYKFTPNAKHLRFIIPLLILLAALFAGQLWLSDRPLQPFTADSAIVAIHMTHHSGFPLKDIPLSPNGTMQTAPEPGLDHPTRLTLEVDSKTLIDETYPMTGEGLGRAALIFEQVRVPVGEHHLVVTMYDRGDPSFGQVIFDGEVTLAGRQILNLSYKDAHIKGNPLAGEQLYYETTQGTNAACRICHSLEPGVIIVGPSFDGIATRAATRVPGMTAEEYIRQSILEPNAYVVEGFPKGQMVQNLGDILTDEQIDDLVAFLLTLK